MSAGGVSIDEVSRRSAVFKTMIYRHWPSRAALLIEACSTIGSAPRFRHGQLRRGSRPESGRSAAALCEDEQHHNDHCTIDGLWNRLRSNASPRTGSISRRSALTRMDAVLRTHEPAGRHLGGHWGRRRCSCRCRCAASGDMGARPSGQFAAKVLTPDQQILATKDRIVSTAKAVTRRTTSFVALQRRRPVFSRAPRRCPDWRERRPRPVSGEPCPLSGRDGGTGIQPMLCAGSRISHRIATARRNGHAEHGAESK
ncbi:transcriptional regulator, TetR family [Lentzea albida]|uniref:Transcriptional regulator, TetR family n=1 Tax=Lentzea albida TaxID=65499 RepID=A0A1H9X6F4_9PSEU|nr:transcriptional regulator, TetR family [Lentzea albida]